MSLGVNKLSSEVDMLCFRLFCAFSVFLLALVSKNCFFCALSVFLWALVSKNYHLKLVCFVSVSSVLFLSSCGPWFQKTIILSWFALFLSLLCSFCLLVGLGVKKTHLYVSVSSVHFLSSCWPWCQETVSSVLFLSSCGPWCQKTLILSWFALFLSLLCSFCLLVGLGVQKLSS